jgi:diguanylate cyclase (GGDEF)-like protein/PAS domain S-box-containing protein
MREPITDLVQLLVLVAFFGIHQRGRSYSYVRFWFVGWIFVFLSYTVWVAPKANPGIVQLQSVVSFDLVLLGTLSFLLALLTTEKLRWKVMAGGVAIGVVNVILINATEFVAVPKVLLALMILLWQGAGFYMGYVSLPKVWVQRRLQILTICIVYGAVMLGYVALTPARNLNNWATGEVLLCTAVLYRKWGERPSLARMVGTVGFVGWAGFYFLNMVVEDGSQMQRVLYEFWSFPKYFVALTMVLKVIEETAEEKVRMADKFSELSDDFRLIYESHPYPMWISDAAEGKFLSANEAALQVYGYDLEEFRGMGMEDLEAQKDPDAEDVYAAFQVPAEGKLIRHRQKDGSVMWVNLVFRDLTYLGREARFVIARDTTDRLKLDQELSHRAQHDVLTGLPNRQLLADRLTQCLKSCEREQKRAAILTIDVDHFKLINDTYGHVVGDECLQLVSERLKSKIRKVDTIARTGGEEFMAVVSGLNNASDGEKVAEALLRVFDTPLSLVVGEVRVTVSIGVAVYPDDGMDADTLRSVSDMAVYRAKRDGRNRAAHGREVGVLEGYAHGEIAACAPAVGLQIL